MIKSNIRKRKFLNKILEFPAVYFVFFKCLKKGLCINIRSLGWFVVYYNPPKFYYESKRIL